MVAKLTVFAATIVVMKGCQGFTIPTTNNNRCSLLRLLDNDRAAAFDTIRRNHRIGSNNRNHRFATTRRRMAANDDVAFLSDDPFVILGLDEPTADRKVLKRAYKKRALKYHPDIVTDIHSPPEEKKKASDRFAKINGAYEKLMGKGGGKGKNDADNSSNRNTNSNTSSGYTPPHRRSSSPYGEGGSGSTDWRDYMPNYGKVDDEQYDTGGDSFGQIFSEMFTGAAGAAVSGGIGGLGGGIFNEFLEFLEGGVAGGFGGASGSDDDDAPLKVLLKTGTLEEVAEEMDDTELVLKQLERKSRDLDDEIFSMDAEAKMAARFSERLEKEERAAELKARKEVVSGYLTRAQKRLLVLQTRYKDLIAYGGQNDDYVTSGGRNKRGSSWGDVREEATSSSDSTTTGGAAAGNTGRRERKTTTTNDDSSSEDAWMNEGFGSSSGRSRGSGRRGSGRRRAAASRSRASSARSESSSSAGDGSNPSSPSPSSYSPSSTRNSASSSTQQPPSPEPTRRRTTTPSSSSSVVSNSNSNYGSDVPPHRRTGSSFASRQEEDRQRMREVKVDEEFEKLKKELGL